jgi:hypothetical protein
MADNYEKAAQQRGSGIVPAGTANDAPDPKLWMGRNQDIKGAPQVFNTLEELIAFHPNKMVLGMRCNVRGHTRGSDWWTPKDFEVGSLPTESEYPLSLDEADSNHYLSFWIERRDNEYDGAEIYEYAPNYTDGGAPPFPYIESDPGIGHPDKAQYDWEQANWGARDETSDQAWVRFRTSNGPWSIPLPINASLNRDDYVNNRYTRSNTKPDTPPRTVQGAPNNIPNVFITGVDQGYIWTDKIQDAFGSGDLYEIRGPKSVYGQLKGDWIGPFLIPEDLNLVRYNSQGSPDPNDIVDTTTTITASDANDIALNNAGWISAPDNDTKYKAQRQDLGGGTYSTWVISKTSAESGEYTSFIYKLMPANATEAYIQSQTPTTDFPEGWYDALQPETDNLINYVSTTIKFFNGVNKRPWSVPRKFTAKPQYFPYITSDYGDTFKYEPTSEGETPVPENTTDITLTAHVDYGDIIDYDLNLPASVNVAYDWDMLYDLDNPGGIPNVGTSRTLVVNYNDIRGIAYYKCTITLTESDTDDIVLSAVYEIKDMTDGVNAKIIEIISDPVYVRVDGSGDPIGTSILTLRAINYNVYAPAHTWVFEYESAIGSDVWYDLDPLLEAVVSQADADCVIDMDQTDGALSSSNGSITAFADAGGGDVTATTSAAHGLVNGMRVTITGTTNYDGTYFITNASGSVFDFTATWVATETGSWSQDGHFSGKTAVRYRIRYTPLTDTETSLIDYVTVILITPDAAGNDGEASVVSIMSNEYTTIATDEGGDPLTGEEGGTYGAARIKTLIYNVEGLDDERNFTIDSVTVSGPGVGGAENQIQVGSDYLDTSGGKYRRGIYISHWGNQVESANITANMTVTLSTAGTVDRSKTWKVTRIKQTNDWRWAFINPDESENFNENHPGPLDFTAYLRDPDNLDAGILKINWKSCRWIVVAGTYNGNGPGYVISNSTNTTPGVTDEINNQTLALTRVNVDDLVVIRVEIQYMNNYYEDKQQIVDQPDGPMKIAYYFYDPVPGDIGASKPTKLADDTTPSVGSDTGDVPLIGTDSAGWYTQPHPTNTFWLSVGRENASRTIIWDEPSWYKGESGSQGANGDGVVYMFIAASTPPTQGSGAGQWQPADSITTLIGKGWSKNNIPAFTTKLYALTGEFTAGYTNGDSPINDWQGPSELYEKPSDGDAAYLYIGYASDSSGTNYSSTPADNLTYIAFRQSTTPLTPVVGDFAGLWSKYKTDASDFWEDPSWTTLFTGITYRKDIYGFVHLRGAVTMNTIGTLGTLPVGYRPVTSVDIPINARYRYQTIGVETIRWLSGSCQITGAGAVITADAGTGDIQVPGTLMFNGVSFFAEN